MKNVLVYIEYPRIEKQNPRMSNPIPIEERRYNTKVF